MAPKDDWKRITLRLPPRLHGQLVRAGETSSLNAEIVRRLEQTFQEGEQAERQSGRVLIPKPPMARLKAVEERLRAIEERLDNLEASKNLAKSAAG